MADALVFSTLKFYFINVLLKLLLFPQTISKLTQKSSVAQRPSDTASCSVQKSKMLKTSNKDFYDLWTVLEAWGKI